MKYIVGVGASLLLTAIFLVISLAPIGLWYALAAFGTWSYPVDFSTWTQLDRVTWGTIAIFLGLFGLMCAIALFATVYDENKKVKAKAKAP